MNQYMGLPHDGTVRYAFITKKKHLAFPKIEFLDVP